MIKKKDSKAVEDIQLTDLVESTKESFNERTATLQRLVMIWRNDHLKMAKQPTTLQVLLNYATYLQEWERQKGNNHKDSYKHFHKDNFRYVKTEKDLYLGFNFIHHNLWKTNFTKTFIDSLRQLSSDAAEQILFNAYIYSQGFIPFHTFRNITPYHEHSHSGPKYYLVNLETEMEKLIISVGVQKHSIFSIFANQITTFEFHYRIQFERIINQQNSEIESILQEIIKENEFSPKQDFIFSELTPIKDPKVINYYQVHKYFHEENRICKIYPLQFQPIQINLKQRENYYFLVRRFEFHQNIRRYLKNSQQLGSEKNQAILTKQIEQMQNARNLQLSFANVSQIIQLLNALPEFKYRLNRQQRDLLTLNGNIIAIGRSGTGKTTCALLRMFGVNFILKKREINKMVLQDPSLTKTICQMKLLEQLNIGKTIFLTFSPYLVKSVRKQYKCLLNSLKIKHAKNCPTCLQSLKNEKQNQQKDSIIRHKRNIQPQQQQVISLNQISNGTLHGFFTVEHILKMIDKTLERSFFDYEKDINNGNIQNDIKQGNVNKYLYSSDKIYLKQTADSVYVDYEFFQKHFWPKVDRVTKNQIKEIKLTPAIIWSEIFSILKGSIHSHSCHDRHISLKMYLKQKRSAFQYYQNEDVERIKTTIYRVFITYRNWCHDRKAYDFMDFVNHLLQEIQFYGYMGPKLNYIFIDEVQDLTSATIFLLSKIVINNIFYCGDTAQAITKGVDFRFNDIKYIFNRQYCPRAVELQAPTPPISLTVNFRSHNNILQLANSVVSILQEIFPSSIDKVQKEISDLSGPKPILILDDNRELFNILLFGQFMKFIPPKQLSEQQVIIVRNKEEQKKLPENLQQGLVFTPESAKGLQFNEVIIYNFFGSSKIDKWKIIEHLEIINEEIEAQKYEKLIKHKNIEEQSQMNEQCIRQERQHNGMQNYLRKVIKKKASLKQQSINLFYELINQLKILYTMITRARNILIIYDTHIPKSLLKLWLTMGLTVFANDIDLSTWEETVEKYTQATDTENSRTDIQKWMSTGQLLLERKEYGQAKKCFRKAKRADLANRVEAMQKVIFADHQSYSLKHNFQFLGKQERQVKKRAIYEAYNGAALIYEKQEYYQDAGDAFFKSQQYKKAISMYQKNDTFQKMADCFMKLLQYWEAYKIYSNLMKWKKAIQCLQQLQEWDKIIDILIVHPLTIRQLEDCKLSKYCLEDLKTLVIHNTIFIQQQPSRIAQGEQMYKEDSAQTKKIISLLQYENLSQLIYQQAYYKQIFQFQFSLQLTDLNYQQNQILKELDILQQKIVDQDFHEFFNSQERQQIKKQVDSLEKKKNQVQSLIDEEKKRFQRLFRKQYAQLILKFKKKMYYEDKSRNLNSNQNLIEKRIIEDIIHRNNSYIQRNNVKQEQEQSYLSLQLLPMEERDSLIHQISARHKVYEELFKYVKFRRNGDFNQHRQTQEQVFLMLEEDDSLKEIISILRKCDNIGDYFSPIFICNQFPPLLICSARYLLNYSLKYSLNYSQNRKNNQIQQIEIQDLRSMYNFFMNINPASLHVSVPQEILCNRYITVNFADQVIMGLLLQGFVDQAVILCPKAEACQLSYLLFRTYFEEKVQNLTGTKNEADRPDYFFFNQNTQLHLSSRLTCINFHFYQLIYNQYDQFQPEPIFNEKVHIDSIKLTNYEKYQIREAATEQIIQMIKTEKKMMLEKMISLEGELEKQKEKRRVFILNNISQCQQNTNKQEKLKEQKQQKQKIVEYQEDYLQQNEQQYERYNYFKDDLDNCEQAIQKCMRNIVFYEDKKIFAEKKISNLKRQNQFIYVDKKQNQATENIEIQKSQNNPNEEGQKDIKQQKNLNQIKVKLFCFFTKLKNTYQNNFIKQILIIAQKCKEYAKCLSSLSHWNKKNQQQKRRLAKKENEIKQIKDQLEDSQYNWNWGQHLEVINSNQNQISRINQKSNKLRQNINWYYRQEKNYTNKIFFIDQQYREYADHLPNKQNVIERKNREKKEQVYRHKIIAKKQEKLDEERQQKKKQLMKKLNFLPEWIQNQMLINLMLGSMQQSSIKRYDQNTQNIKHTNIIYETLSNVWKLNKIEKKSTKLCNIIIIFLNYLYSPSTKTYMDSLFFEFNKEEIQQVAKQLKLRHLYIMPYQHNKHKYSRIWIQLFIQKVSQQSQPFISILLAFYGCRVVVNCPLLSYLENDYAFIKIDSPLHNKIKSDFLYNFDHEDSIALCKTVDALSTVLPAIRKRFLSLGFDDREVLSQRYCPKKDDESYKYMVRCCWTSNMKQEIDFRYLNDFQRLSKMKMIEQSIQKLLSQFLELSFHKDTESFHFVMYQLKQYGFIRQVYAHMQTFNMKLLKQLDDKLNALMKQYDTWKLCRSHH